MAIKFQKESLAPLQEKEFRLYILARFVYIMGLRMVATVVAYKLFQLTQSSLAIGLVGLSEFIPVFCLALYAGHVIDKSDKRSLLLKGIISYALCVLALVVLTIPSVEQKLGIQKSEYCFYGIIFLKKKTFNPFFHLEKIFGVIIAFFTGPFYLLYLNLL